MSIRRMLSVIATLVCVFSCVIPAYAASEESGTGVCVYSQKSCNPDELNGLQRSTSKPKNECTENPYYANLKQVGNSKLYTNYYFRNVTSLDVTFNVTGDDIGTFQVGLYDMTTDEIVDTNDFLVTCAYGTCTASDRCSFSNLNSSHKYAVYFSSVYACCHTVYFSGSATVSW